MDRAAFKADTRYTLTWRDETGRERPLNVYVYRVYEKFMIVRETSGPGLVRKVAFDDVARIVHETPVPPPARFFLPAAVLDEKNWRERAVMQHYASAPGLGK
ncbi:MAG: hypothetical protein LJE97_17830 [Betaproteobacteria bacterium]|jgi:hypothetical protein|nr:hypothetical protein [Betaproteobacteria bacterium]